MTHLFLTVQAPFALAAVIRSHGWVQLAPFRAIADNAQFTYITQLPSGRVVELTVHESEGGVAVQVDDGLDGSEREQVAAQLHWMLGLDQEFSEFYELARREPKLAGAIDQAQGRILRSPTLFEDTVKTILTTNTSWSGTKRMVNALVSQFGDPLPEEPSRRAFPSASELAAAGAESLRTEVGLGYRAPYVAELARSVASGELDLEVLKASELATPQLHKRLLAMKGVGAYSAANLLMLLGRYDFLPIDSWALKVVSHEWHGGKPIGKEEVEAAFQPWGRWRGLAYWFWKWSYFDQNQ